MKVLGNGIVYRIARWCTIRSPTNHIALTFRTVSRTATPWRSSQPTRPANEKITQANKVDPSVISQTARHGRYNARVPGPRNGPHGEDQRMNWRKRKGRMPHKLRTYLRRREVLLSTALRHLQDSKSNSERRGTTEGSPKGKVVSHPESTVGYGLPFVRPPSEDCSDQQEKSGFKPEAWSNDWGSDALAPPVGTQDSTTTFRRRLPPHVQPCLYTRRSEGFLHDSARGVESSGFITDVESPSDHKPIARLAHGLSRVLFNPGVHWLQDPRSRVYNFPPWLESIPKVTDFAFERVTGFVKSSQDNDLHELAKRHDRPFVGSTSSLTGLLSHIYFLVSGDREVDTSPLSRAFAHEPATFTPGQRMPTSVILNYKDGVYSIDADKVNILAEKNVLTWMGTMLEKFLTLPESEFKKLLRSAPELSSDQDSQKEAYRYAMTDSFIMRSQLDCIDSRLPGTGVFDIKTRAAVPIRLDVLNYEENSGYLIRKLTGSLESFEKEYYDLIRSAFLKYSFQARIGNMDGVLVTYHNTARVFGFQYIPLEEMEARLYGLGDGGRVFEKCLRLLECILKEIVDTYGKRSVRCTFDKRDQNDQLDIFVEPANWDEVSEGKSCPITQLEVRVESFLHDMPVRGSTAVASDKPWLIHWVISRSVEEESDIRDNLAHSQRRQLRALNFPAGVENLADMAVHWEKIDFGRAQLPESPIPKGNGHESDQPMSLDRSLAFRSASPEIEHLRRLAREGRDEILRLEAEEATAGREKIVWGSADDFGQAEYIRSNEVTAEDTSACAAGCDLDKVVPSLPDEPSGENPIQDVDQLANR